MTGVLRAIFGLIVAIAVSVLPAWSAIDQLYQKPATEKSWGRLLADYVGYEGYSKSHAVVIGISRYKHHDNLPTARDAINVRDFLLNEAGFDTVHVLTEENVKRHRLRELMLDVIPKRVKAKDRFFFYWSGHGIDRATQTGGKDGYLPLSTSAKDAIHEMVGMEEVARWNRYLKAKQSLYVLDACFSGLAAISSKNDRDRLTPGATRAHHLTQLDRPSHEIISAGTGTEETIAGGDWNGSLFTWALLNGLRGSADAQAGSFSKDGLVSASELMTHLKITIEREVRSKGWNKQITPQIGSLRGHEGEFFFLSRLEKERRVAALGQQASGTYKNGVPVVTKSASGGVSADPPEDVVREAQSVLKQLGYDPGSIDGRLGLRTRGVVRGFQRRSSLPVTGLLDETTLTALEEAWSRQTRRTTPEASQKSQKPAREQLVDANVIAKQLEGGWSYKLSPGHTKEITTAVFSSDGTKLASGSGDKTVLLWDVGTGRLIRSFAGHEGGVNSVDFSADGSMLASGSFDSTVRLWDVGTGRTIRSFKGHGGWVNSVDFSPDGSLLASGSSDKSVRLWDVGTGRLIRSFAGHGSGVSSVDFSADGSLLASGSLDSTVRLWDVGTGRLIRILEGHGGWVRSVDFSADGSMLASGSDDKIVRLWDVGTGRLIRSLEGHGSTVSSVDFGADGSLLASGSFDTTVRLWDVGTGRLIRSLEGHGGWVRSVDFSADGSLLASASGDKTVRLWDVDIANPLQR